MRWNIAPRWYYLLVALSGLFLLILYAYSTGFLSVSCDEYAKGVLAGEGLKRPNAWLTGVWLPFHLGLIGVTSVVTGDLWLASRLVSMFSGVVLVVSLWRIGRLLGGELAGGLAAALAATHPLVVLLSATAMVDIVYVALVVLALSLYLRFSYAETPRAINLFGACGALTIACGCHYNAWIAVAVFLPFLLRDLYRATLPRRVVLCALVLLGSVPAAWIAWNYRVHSGNPLFFLTQHTNYSANFWIQNGYHASARAAIRALCRDFYLYTPVAGILAFLTIGMLFTEKNRERRQFITWFVLMGFLGGLVYLYATGGRPAAFEPRYILLPSVLMVLFAAGLLNRLWHTRDRTVRSSSVLLTIGVVVLNVSLLNGAIRELKKSWHFYYAIEARHVAKRMHHLKSEKAARMVVEVKGWNYLALNVFLNRFDAVVMDRELLADPIKQFDNPSILLGSRENVLRELKTRGVGFIAAYSPKIKGHVEEWGLNRIARVDTYSIYRVPR
jgi:hypothetical protein